MDYKGTIIEESLFDRNVLKQVKILGIRTEKVTERHKTPWLKVWTLDKVEIPERTADDIADEISRALDTVHHCWYVDFRNDKLHYIIFANRIFKVNRKNQEEYEKAKEYGMREGIPEYQLTWSFDEF